MSLLGVSQVSPARMPTTEETTAILQQQDPMTQPHAPHEALLKQAVQWISRDDLYMMSVRNAILLDSLAMAGASEQIALNGDEEEDA